MGKIYTIKQNGLFSRVYNKGVNIVGKNIAVYALKCKSGARTKIGITINRKLGGAVERNRAKRLIREAYRTLSLSNPELFANAYLFVFVARARCLNKKTKMQYVRRDMEYAMRKLCEKQ